jgi:hypothetical protein
MRFSLLSATSVQDAPYTLGFAFRRGQLPANRTVAPSVGQMQVAIKNRWNDGSIKFAVLSGRATLAANVPLHVGLSPVPVVTAPAALGLPDLRRANPTAEIAASGIGTARWQGTDWDSPFVNWVAGPEMSSWIYRKPVGSDTHLVAWLEVRVYAGGQVEVLPWVENGYIAVAAPGNRSATYTFTLGGTQRFAAAIDLKHHTRTVLISGAALAYWLGNGPELVIGHDKLYLQATELVPAYASRIAPGSALIAALPASYTPLAAGSFNYSNDSMASSGYQDPIGLLPQHDVLYLVSDATAAYAATVRNGFSAGRWALHYRDEATNRPLRFSRHPNRVIGDGQGFKDNGGSTTNSRTPVPTGGNPPQWDCAHSPSVGYLAYLVTGRFYFMEQALFAATANYLGNGDNAALRNGAQGLVQTAIDAWQTRSCAWDWRTRVQALTAVPDDDRDLRQELVNSVEANIEHFHGRYVAQANNPWGWILPGETYSGSLRFGACWQQDFVTAAFGFSLSLDLPVSPAAAGKLRDFFHWKARSIVSRLGPQGEFWYINAAPFTMSISSAAVPNFVNGSGPWYATAREVYNATYATPPGWLGATEGTLAGEIMPGERAMWGNLQSAIAYAVRHGVPGALAAYNRMTSARNWSALRDALAGRPVWAVVPTVTAPAWLAGKRVGEWVEIPGTAGAGGSAVDAFCGMGLDDRTSEIVIAAAGGHNDSADNRVVSLRLTDDSPQWLLRRAASTITPRDVSHYPDGLPVSRHLYQSIHVVPELNRVFLFGSRGSWSNAFDFPNVDAFNLLTNQWDARDTWRSIPAGHYGAVRVRTTGEVFMTTLQRWDPASQTFSPRFPTRLPDPVRWPIAHDSRRDQLFAMQWADGQGFGDARLFTSRFPMSGSAQIAVTLRGADALAQLAAERPSYSALDYDPDNDRFLFYDGRNAAAGRVYAVAPNDTNTWDIEVLTLAAGTALPPSVPVAGVHSRFRYVPALRGFVLLANAQANLWFLKTA